MPKFAPNQGFKMPGVGSKEIDSPSNFRDEQHVDKVGYCDTTEDSMLPKGSSPLKARYTSSGYLKDLDVITLPRASKKECPEGSVKKDGKCVPVGDTKKPPPQKINPKGSVKVPELGDLDISYDKTVTVKGPSKTTTGGYKGKKMSDEAWKALSPEERRRLNAAAGADKSGKITKTTGGGSLTGKTKI